MVAETFNVIKDSSATYGWKIESVNDSNIIFDIPENVYDAFGGKYIDADEMLDRVSTIRVAIAGHTNSFREVDHRAFDRNSVIKTFTLKTGINTIDDTIDSYITVPDGDDVIGAAAKEYEKFHIMKMDRDIDGDDDSIHAYIQTPADGKLRCIFAKDIRLDAKRNNIKYWIDDYRIASGSNGGKFVRIISTPREL